MHPREKFLKGKVKMIKIYLDIFCENCETCSVLEDDKRIKKIIKLLLEIREKANILRKITDDKL